MNNVAKIETLFLAHYEALHRYAFSILKDTDEAGDMVQSVFLKLLEKQDNLNIETSAKAYLFRSVYHQCINHIKKEAAKEKHYSGLATEGYAELEQVSPGEHEEALKQRIDKVLDQLPPQCRTVFIKSRAEQKKYVEIAVELNISVKTVEAHMSKALKLIRQILRVLIVIFCLITELNK